MCRYSLAMGSGLGWSLGGESAHEKMAIGAWAVDCILEAPRVKVGFGALGMGGYQDMRGQCFPEGMPDITESGWVTGGCHQGPRHNDYGSEFQGKKGSLQDFHQSCLG